MFAREKKPSQDVVADLKQGICLRRRPGNRASVGHDAGEVVVSKIETDFAPALWMLCQGDAETYIGS